MSDNIRVVLVNPSHPGNVGAAARAMKTMELHHLYLVKPKEFPHANATALAAGADDLLAKAVITSSLAEALAGSNLVFGTSARLRALSLPTLTPHEAAQLITNKAALSQIAILFGRENNGLTNEELAMCNYHIHIPTNSDFNSLNIAAAVQLIAYEIKIADKTKVATPRVKQPNLANSEEIQAFYQHLQQTLKVIDFLKPQNQQGLMAKLKRLFNRSQLEKSEINILRGILTMINSLPKQ